MEQYLDIGYQIVVGLSMVCAGATVIAKLTETKKDDEIIAKIHKYLKAIADLKRPEDETKK